jgi:hypothetical protein
MEQLERIYHTSPVHYNFLDLSLSLVLSPFKIIIGVIKTIFFAIIIPIRGAFYETGIKGYFIDNFVLAKDDYDFEKHQKYSDKISKVESFDAIQLEHSGEKRTWVVYIPGMTANIISSMKSIEAIHEAGFNVICMNHSGVGYSHKLNKPHSIETLIEPSCAAYRLLAGKKVIFWGHSLGGAIAVEAAKKVGCKDIIIDRSFGYLFDAIKDVPKYIFFPFNRFLAYISHEILPFNTNKNLENIDANVTIICHKGDEVISSHVSTRKVQNNHRKIEFLSPDCFTKSSKTSFPNHTGTYIKENIQLILNEN